MLDHSTEAGPTNVPWRLRVATYNIHGCVGTDGKLDLPRIANVLKVGVPDVVGLNEVYRYFSGTTQDQALAGEMGPDWTSVFGKTIHKPLAQYGNAVLTRLPVISSESWLLDDFARQERRGLLRVTVRKDDRIIHVFCTHMGLNGIMRARAAEQVLGIMKDFTDGQTILLGDFNETVPAVGLDALRTGGLTDAWEAFGLSGGKTFPSRPVLRRLDYIWLGKELVAESCYVATHADARIASDHLPVFATLLRSDDVAQHNGIEGADETADEVSDNALVLEDFQKIAGAEMPPWWHRVTARFRGEQDNAELGGVAIAGEEHFWRQKSRGEAVYERKFNKADLDNSHGLYAGTRVQMVNSGEGWTFGLGNITMQVRHQPGDFPVLDILAGSQVLSSGKLIDSEIDPYSWNSYILELIPATEVDASRAQVYVNGQRILSAETSNNEVTQNCSSVTLKTNGGDAGTCEIFADDFVVWQQSITISGASDTSDRLTLIFPPRVIRRSQSGEKVWWLDLW